ncbi:MAG: pyruvate dehydrogenase (acetyl-transferring) E1 component subunit alpha [Desulfobacca sp.]|uniref:pyruvate dehydrogenase (acetyl-transferring) E1 component subunit alpha n=1 Tax=Desulfobacca sp. TaxID=2067990 RepID=UPI00404B6F5B
MNLAEFDPLSGRRVEILDREGTVVSPAWRPADLTDDRLLHLYDQMVFLRVADQQALTLQRAGRMGTYAPVLGQEAANIGSAAVLQEGDWLVPSFREMGAMLLRGVPLMLIYMYWMGSEWGSHFPENVRVLPICAPVATQTLHGVGLAWAAKLKQEQTVTLIYFGDGATSKGDCHEAMNFAGVFQTPCIFFCQNNQYAISVPRSLQTAAATLAQRAIAYGFPGVVVDGNDLLAVYAATQAAVDRARSGLGPVFIEAQTYRLGPHTTADDPSRYRAEAELQAQEPFDPLQRVRLYLEKQGLLTPAAETERWERYRTLAKEEAKKAEAAIPLNPDDIFDYHYATLPPYLSFQKEYLHRILRDAGEPSDG